VADAAKTLNFSEVTLLHLHFSRYPQFFFIPTTVYTKRCNALKTNDKNKTILHFEIQRNFFDRTRNQGKPCFQTDKRLTPGVPASACFMTLHNTENNDSIQYFYKTMLTVEDVYRAHY